MRSTCRSPEETRRLAGSFAETLKSGDVVVLVGELGAGKTTFVRGIADRMGIDERIVSSPTFTLMNLYPGPVPLIHVDFYRLPDSEQFFFEELEEHMESGGVIVIEWGDRFSEAVKHLGAGRGVFRVHLRMISDTVREVTIEESSDH